MNLEGKTIQPITIPHSDSLHGSKSIFSALSILSLTPTHILSKCQLNYSQIILKESPHFLSQDHCSILWPFLISELFSSFQVLTNALGFSVFLETCSPSPLERESDTLSTPVPMFFSSLLSKDSAFSTIPLGLAELSRQRTPGHGCVYVTHAQPIRSASRGLTPGWKHIKQMVRAASFDPSTLNGPLATATTALVPVILKT